MIAAAALLDPYTVARAGAFVFGLTLGAVLYRSPGRRRDG